MLNFMESSIVVILLHPVKQFRFAVLEIGDGEYTCSGKKSLYTMEEEKTLIFFLFFT